MQFLVFVAAACAAFAAAAPVVDTVVKPQVFERSIQMQGREDTVKLYIKVGNKSPQHVGFTHGDALAKEVKKALKDLCRDGLTGNICERGTYRINNIDYEDPDGWHANEAHLKISALEAWIPESHQSLREVFIDEIADAFGAASDIAGKTCYETKVAEKMGKWKFFPFPNTVTFCNAPDSIEITMDDSSLGNPRMHAQLRFNGATTSPKYDCVGALTPIWNTLDRDRTNHFDDARGKKILYFIDCADGSKPKDSNAVDTLAPPTQAPAENATTEAQSLQLRDGNLGVNVFFDNQPQHVGYLYGDKLESAMRNALDTICVDDGTDGDVCDLRKTHAFHDIAYKDSNNWVATDAYVEVKVRSAWVPHGYHDLRSAMIVEIADAFGRASELESSCITEKLLRPHLGLVDVKFCRAPTRVEIFIKDDPLGRTHMYVDLAFNGATIPSNNLPCDSTEKAIESTFDEEERRKHFIYARHRGLNFYVTCH